jgi:hypothetical protein
LIGSLFSLPYMLLFYAAWILASLMHPLNVVAWIAFVSHPAAALRKAQLFLISLQYLALCNDKKWKKPKDPAIAFEGADESQITRKTVIFIRHGESTWNDTFNKGDRALGQFLLYFIPNLIQSVVYEIWFGVTGQAQESWFFDAPLSAKGVQQAMTLHQYLQSSTQFLPPKEAAWLKLLQDPSQTQLVTSNLRRAISTLLIAFQNRWSSVKEPSFAPSPEPSSEPSSTEKPDSVWIWSCLQEISRNPDALSITPAQGAVIPAWTDPPHLRALYTNSSDPDYTSGSIMNTDSSRSRESASAQTQVFAIPHPGHDGNKAVNSTGLSRLEAFCHLVFTQVEKPAVVATGHSLWFKSFFQTYLPYSVDHISKRKKLVNGGTVAFTLQHVRLQDQSYYMIDPKSMQVLHGGF